MADGFDCTQCGTFANPAVYRPGTPERLRMEATRKCRDCSAGDVLGTDDELPGILDSWDAQERLTAWRDAAVARHLAEAGAVHPAVHTPTRIMQWLEQRNWWREPDPDPNRWAVEWANADAQQHVYVPQHADTADYAMRAYDLLCIAAVAADLTLNQALAEVAAMPEEWSW